MTKFILPAAVAILALLAAAPFANAQAQQPSESRLAQILKRFPQADTDKDGKLTAEEFKAARKQFRQSRQGNARPAAAAQPTQAGDAVQGKGKASVEAPTVGTGEVAAKWKIKPTFPNEAYGPRTDVNPDLIGDNHLFDVWVPDGDGPYPVMIYAHGGGFSSGSKTKALGSMPKLAEDKVVFISINYTLKQGPKVAINEGVDAINYIKANHEKYKIDPKKIFLNGNSAGGIMMNYIIYSLKMPDILGVWHGAYYKTQGADLSIDNLRAVGIPIAISMGKLYPADAGHSPLAAVTLLEKNVAAGNPGMWIGSTDGNAEQVWLNGEWILDVKKGIDTGKSYPKRAEWIHSIAAAVAEPISQHPQTRIKGIIQP